MGKRLHMSVQLPPPSLVSSGLLPRVSPLRCAVTATRAACRREPDVNRAQNIGERRVLTSSNASRTPRSCFAEHSAQSRAIGKMTIGPQSTETRREQLTKIPRSSYPFRNRQTLSFHLEKPSSATLQNVREIEETCSHLFILDDLSTILSHSFPRDRVFPQIALQRD